LHCSELDVDGGDCPAVVIGDACWSDYDEASFYDCSMACTPWPEALGDGFCDWSLDCEETSLDLGDCE
jgi:hypothetical protein